MLMKMYLLQYPVHRAIECNTKSVTVIVLPGTHSAMLAIRFISKQHLHRHCIPAQRYVQCYSIVQQDNVWLRHFVDRQNTKTLKYIQPSQIFAFLILFFCIFPFHVISNNISVQLKTVIYQYFILFFHYDQVLFYQNL